MALRKPVDLAFFVIFLHRYVFELKFCEWNIRLTSHHWPRLSWYYGIKWLIWLVSCNSRALIYILLSLFVSTVRVWLLRLPPDRFWYHDSSSSRVLSSTFVTKPIIKTEIDFEKTQIPPPSPVKKKKKKKKICLSKTTQGYDSIVPPNVRHFAYRTVCVDLGTMYLVTPVILSTILCSVSCQGSLLIVIN